MAARAHKELPSSRAPQPKVAPKILMSACSIHFISRLSRGMGPKGEVLGNLGEPWGVLGKSTEHWGVLGYLYLAGTTLF